MPNKSTALSILKWFETVSLAQAGKYVYFTSGGSQILGLYALCTT